MSKYRTKIAKPEDIFVEIRDIVGTRITCNTLNDAYAVAREIKSVATSEVPNRPLVKQHDDYEDDYIKNPKESGYRALSLLVGIPVSIGDTTEYVGCEIQIRTLLQHAWGELTHEDTYKPEMRIPGLIVVLSKRLANTLAVLDEIAQDIRNELDKLESDQAASILPPEPAAATAPGFPLQSEAGTAATEQETAAPPQEPLPLPPTPPLTMQTIQEAFLAVFGRAPNVEENLYNGLLARLRVAGISSASEIEGALLTMKSSIEDTEREYSQRVSLNDYGRLLYAPFFKDRKEEGIQQVRAVFEEHVAKEQQFETKYQVGTEVLGTVVHVAPDYALVQPA